MDDMLLEQSKIEEMNLRFAEVFREKWAEFLQSLNTDLSSAQQLHIGNHMRPQLVFWGSLLNKNIFDNINYTQAANVAVGIEAVHKASVIIDDIIDGDTKRRGALCMHQSYGNYQTVLFAVCMLSQGISRLTELDQVQTVNSQFNIIKVLCDTIHSMCLGAIAEISAPIQDQIDISFVQKIIDCETAQLIKNSLYMGYLLNSHPDITVGETLCTIGTKCGYVFQVMNDLEPFCNQGYIEQYKGAINSDILRSRKNIVLPHLYKASTDKEREHLLNAIHYADSFDFVLALFEKYEIRKQLAEELESIYHSVLVLLQDIGDMGFPVWAKTFCQFVELLRVKYMSVLYPR